MQTSIKIKTTILSTKLNVTQGCPFSRINSPFQPGPVFSCPCLASEVHPCPVLNIVFPPYLLSTFSSFPFTVPLRIVFAKPEGIEMWPNHISFRFFTKVRSSSCFSMAAWIFQRASSLVTCSLNEMFSNLR